MDADSVAGQIPDQAAPVSSAVSGDWADPPVIGATAAMAPAMRVPRRVTWWGAAVFVVSLAILAALAAAYPASLLDLQIYRWAGQLVLHSGDLYGAHFPHYGLRFTYTPMAAAIFSAVSILPMSLLKWIVTVASIGALVATLWIAWGTLGYQRRDRIGPALAVAGVALWLEPVQQTLGFGQVNLVLMLVVIADICLADGRWFQGVGIGLAAGFKLTPLIFIPYLLLTRRFRAAGVAVATFCLTIAGSLLLLPTASRQYWLDGLFLEPGRTGNIAYVGNQSLRGALTRLLDSGPAAQPYWAAASVVVAIAGLALAALAARRGQEMIGILTCALTGLLVSPVSWSHHWVWIAPGLVVAADLAARREARASSGGASADPATRPATGQRWSGWRRRAGWAGVILLAVPFVALPQGLVPATMVQGADVHGPSLLTSSLYVVAGVTAGCLVGLRLVRERRAGSAQAIE
jgi:alpha-1,2-mannosyltransferase